MELKKRLDFRKVLVSVYVVFFAVYLIVGLQPAEAVNYEISAELSIPSIGLTSDVTALTLENHELDTPDTIVGSFSKYKNKTLLIGHSSTVFRNLHEAMIGDEIVYDEDYYKIVDAKTVEKNTINMNELLAKAESETIVIMTCAGEDLGEGDATHRLIVTAVKF